MESPANCMQTIHSYAFLLSPTSSAASHASVNDFLPFFVRRIKVSFISFIVKLRILCLARTLFPRRSVQQLLPAPSNHLLRTSASSLTSIRILNLTSLSSPLFPSCQRYCKYVKPFNQFLSYLIIWNFSLALIIVILSSRVSLSPPQPPISAESSNTADKKTSQCSHIPLIYGSLHWHPLKFRIIFKFLLLTYIIYITYIHILTYKDLIAGTNLFDQPIMVSLLCHALILKPEVITLSLQCSPQTLEQPSSAYHVC